MSFQCIRGVKRSDCILLAASGARYGDEESHGRVSAGVCVCANVHADSFKDVYPHLALLAGLREM